MRKFPARLLSAPWGNTIVSGFCLASGWLVYFLASLGPALGRWRNPEGGGDPSVLIPTAWIGGTLVVFSFLILRSCRSEFLRVRELEAANAESLRQRAICLRAREEASEFLHVAAHDMQAPLRHVTGFVQLLLGQKGFPEDASSKKYAGYILEGVEQMSAMIVGLVEFGKIGKSEPQSVRVDLNEVIGKASRILSGELTAAGAGLEVAGSLPTVTGNQTYLDKMAQYLLRNCLAYKSPDRPLKIKVSAFQDEVGVGIRIEDNGMGIAPENREKVFAPFKRLHSYDKIKGCGLGLSLARRIAEGGGGKVFLEDSALGGIAVVTVFPAAT